MRQGVRWHAVVQAVLPLRGQAMARGRSGLIQRRPRSAKRAATTSGHISITRTLFPCRTSGSIRGTPRGIWRFIAFRWRWSIPISPRISSCCMLREWYMHPNGQIPAYEWAFGDVNPPVHAWAAWRVYKIDSSATGKRDRALSGARLPQAAAQFHLVGESQRCEGQEYFSGRLSRPRQYRGVRSQRNRCPLADTSNNRMARAGWPCTRSTCSRSRWNWRAEEPCYEDVASKFWEHFIYIAHAMSHRGDDGEHGFVERGGRVFLRCVANSPDGPGTSPCECGRWWD